MFSSLTAFLAPSVSHDTRLAWTEHGGRLAKYDELVKEESPEHAIDYWIGSHGQADELVDRLRVLGIKTPLMRVVPATPPTNAAPPVTPTRRSTLLRFEPLQALSAMPEDSSLSRASAGHSRMSTVDSDVAVELYLLGPPVSTGLGPQATDMPRLDELQASAAPRVAPVQIQQPEDARPDAFFAFEGSPSPQPASRPLHPLEDLHERLTAGMTALDGVPTLPAGIVFAASSHSHDEDRLCLDERPQQDFKVLKHAQDVFRVSRRDRSVREIGGSD
ncbi:BRCT domain containing protein [Rhodotorula toruloides]|uniref:BRCT domain containing protein n=1 Tax=Rhodotorula toruloides TaxID=5286 RepID=A0A511KCF8_RHOTO|nr:BRCT domain containing protein [Rhodotorula toruloides]